MKNKEEILGVIKGTKDLHIKFPHKLFLNLKSEVQKNDISFQHLFRVFALMLLEGDKSAVAVVKSASEKRMKQKLKEISEKASKNDRKYQKYDTDALYRLIDNLCEEDIVIDEL
jgi:hypothetical protein